MALTLSKNKRPEKLSAFSPLRHQHFLIIWLAAITVNVGGFIGTIAQSWHVLQLSNSPLFLSLVPFANLAPSFFLSLFGGIIADRYSRRNVLIAQQLVNIVTLSLVTILTFTGQITVWHILIAAFLNGIMAAFGFPAWRTFLSDLLPEEDLQPGLALNAMQFNLARVIGPAIGGIMVWLVGIAGSYLTNVLTYVSLLATLLVVKAPQKKVERERHSVWYDLLEGITYTIKDRQLVFVLSIQLILAFFLIPYMTYMPVFARDVFHIDSVGLGWLNMSIGIGALIGSFITVGYARKITIRSKTLYVLPLIAGLFLIVFAWSPLLLPSMAILAILGASTSMSFIIGSTLVQSTVEEAFRARVFSIWVLLTSGLAPLSYLPIGWAAEHYGVHWTLTLMGGLSSVIIGVLVVFHLRHRSEASIRAVSNES